MPHSTQNKREQSTYFELFAYDGDTIKSVIRIEVEGIRDHFRALYDTVLGNGDILLYISQFEWTVSPPSIAPDYPRYYSGILLDGQKMNFISSTKDYVVAKKQLTLYPNPTTGIVKDRQSDHSVRR